ncbi:Transcriptional regulator, MocR family, putative Taurine regulator tauR [Candidatus Rhodobacter oscarellae]|uniref:Transcriptional regulator, MocR family, putative Taurine regulator tauR n=1 Tax=Candidatus Rhodobacter oscarellae TaxID=1675527 RepID=A0A0J9E6V4_9RHOB|nr:PLP-dependent aminotransferase family protein [Candidatus Rhodobacter lobularis]KMW58406.1 Transcriptional regulator, MocR family, putative Taurine regulator tauR [Candidatus Rhodobacter lobularis]
MVIPAESFVLDPSYEGTLQQQIQELVTEGILSGRLQPGERMPSSRRLSEQLGVSRITVTLAYTELVSNDFLRAEGRSGYFVSENAPRPPVFDIPDQATADSVDWTRAIGQRFSRYAPLVRPSDWRRYKFPFIYGQADATLFDHQNWRQCALKALGQRDFEAMTADYYERDDARLIEFITRHILPRRGIAARPQEVLLTLGAQNALWMAAQVLLTQRRTAAIENPCYPGLREILEPTRCKLDVVDVDAGGLPPEALSSEVDVVFTTASHQSPTNATMPVERRRALLARAAQDGFIIVEDDYEFEMSFARSPSPALKSLDQTGAVVYIGSFSKSVFPGLRLGYLVGSETFIREARALRGLVLRHPPGHIQRTVAYFLSLGHYDAQVRRMGTAYAERRAVMEAAIHEFGLDLAAPSNFGGSSFWMRAPEGVDTIDLAQRLREMGVLIEPGRAFFGPEDENNAFYRLAYSSIPKERITEGIGLIADALAA